MMNVQQKTFLQCASDMEYDRYQMEQLLERFTSAGTTAENRCRALKREQTQLAEQKAELQKKVQTNRYKAQTGDVVAGMVPRLIGMLVLLFIEGQIGFGILTLILTPLEALVGMNGLMVVCFLLIPGFLSYRSEEEKANRKNNTEHKEQREQIRRQDVRIEEIKKEENGLRTVSGPYYRQEADRCRRELTKLNTARENFYKGSALHTKYRNAPATATLLEYFETGRCGQLEGHGGAVDVFEQELRLNKIVDSTERISRQLNTVIQNQAQILNRVEQINDKVDNLIHNMDDFCRQTCENQQQMQRSLDRISYNTELTGYYAEVTARCAKYLAWKEGYSYYRYL